MKVVELIDIDLLASSVAQAAHDNFTMAGSWDTDELVYVINESDDTTPRYPVEIYISLEDANTGNYPPTSATKWSLVGVSNRWEMFDGYVNTQTEDTDDIEVEIDSSLTNYVGLFKLQGLTVTLSQIVDAVVKKTETISLKVDYPVNYWNYFFGEFFYKEDIGWEYPHYADSSLEIKITTQAGTAKCGMVAIGKSYELGKTKYDPQIGIADYSKKDTDSLGRTYLAQGAYAKTLEVDAWFPTSTVDFINRRLTAVRGIPSILDANNTEMAIDDVESMIIYGFFIDFRITIPGPTKSKCSIEYEGLI